MDKESAFIMQSVYNNFRKQMNIFELKKLYGVPEYLINRMDEGYQKT